MLLVLIHPTTGLPLAWRWVGGGREIKRKRETHRCVFIKRSMRTSILNDDVQKCLDLRVPQATACMHTIVKISPIQVSSVLSFRQAFVSFV